LSLTETRLLDLHNHYITYPIAKQFVADKRKQAEIKGIELNPFRYLHQIANSGITQERTTPPISHSEKSGIVIDPSLTQG